MLTLKTPFDKQHLRDLFIDHVKAIVSCVLELPLDDKDRRTAYVVLRQALVVLKSEKVISQDKFEEAEKNIDIVRPALDDSRPRPNGKEEKR